MKIVKHFELPQNNPAILVATYRSENSEWIQNNHFYNLPLMEGVNPNDYSVFSHVVLYSGDRAPLAYVVSYLGVTDKKWLASTGYSNDIPGHAEKYILFALQKKINADTLLKTGCACICYCSSRVSGVVTPEAYVNGKFNVEGNSTRNALEKLKPYIKKDINPLYLFNPGQTDFLRALFPNRIVPLMEPLRYASQKIGDVDLTVVPGTNGAQPFRLGEFFCGPGGLACGAMSARIENPAFKIEHAWANDYDQDTCNTYAENICRGDKASVICHDVRTLDISDKRLSKIDGFAFGFPCNDFSVVGEHKGFDGTYGPLYQYGVAVLKKFKPQWFVAENVGGLASANEGSAFKVILQSMKEAGYRIYPHLYKFEEYGVPQARHRIIIIGIRKNLPYVFYPPSPLLLAKQNNSARAALETPPIPSWTANNERTAQSDVVVRRLQYIKPGQNAFTANLPPELRLNVKGAKISQIYKRLDPDKPAYTVTGSGGGGTHIYHYSEPRALTNRERARLQTFPDKFVFTGSKESARKQIGMAVPPRGAQIIFEALLRTLAGIAYEHVDCNITDDGVMR